MKSFLLNIITLLILIPVCCTETALAQTERYPETKIHGLVRDSVTREPLPFVNVYLKGSDLGVVTDSKGEFRIETKANFLALQISSLGYKTRDVYVKKGTVNNITVNMVPDDDEGATVLQEVVVTKKNKAKYSKKNNPAVELMEKIRKAYPKTDPKNHDYYSYDKYEKMVFALNDFSPEEKDNWFTRKFDFIFEFCDTSELSGKPILPISVKEKSSKMMYRRSPGADKEVVQGRRSTGIDDVFNNESIQRFLDDVFREIDIYQNDITLMQNRFVSPLSHIASNYYKFYLQDTIMLDGKPHIELTFVPHNPESFGFNGRLYVEKEDSNYFIKKVVMQVPKAINLNYVKNIYIVQDYEKGANGERNKVNDDMTVEFEIIPGTQGLYARRHTGYRNFSFDKEEELEKYYEQEGKTFVQDFAMVQPEQYWRDVRQFPIKTNEESMKSLLAKLRQVPAFYWTEKVVVVLVSGYIKTGKESKFDFGPMNTLISANTAEGARFRIGGITTANLSKHWFARGYVAYGCRDHKFKYGGEVEYSLFAKKYHSREFPINSFRLRHEYDLNQIGQHYLFTNADNIFLSWKRQPDTKVTYRRRTIFEYKMERRGGFMFTLGLKHDIQEPSRWMPFENGFGDVLKRYTSAAFTLTLRYAPGETFYQTKTDRIPINMDAPVFQLTHEFGPKGFLGSNFCTNRTEFSVSKRFWFSSFGYADCMLKAGKIWSTVYYPALMWPNVNLSYTIQPESFTLMNAMEFANDQYFSWDLTYWGNGVLFNRLPIIKYLRLREVLSFRGLYGKLSERNDPSLHNDLLQFPFDAFTASMKKQPYMELGVGIDNILTILRIDYVWRLTYRDTPNVDKSGIRVQLHFTF